MPKMVYDDENVEISTGKSGKIRHIHKMENSKRNNSQKLNRVTLRVLFWGHNSSWYTLIITIFNK
jgi:hypothetical protein